MDDQSIIALYFARDEQALTESEREYGRYCMTVSLNILERRQDAEECVNDTWLRAWNSIPPTRPRSLKAYLGRICRNLSLNRLRDRRNADLTLAFEELEECIPIREEQVSDLPDLLDGFLRTLSDTDRRLMVGRYWYGHTARRLGEVYGLSENAVQIRLSRTRAALRAYLTERGYSV